MNIYLYQCKWRLLLYLSNKYITRSFRALSSVSISHLKVTFRFDSVCIVVACCVNLRQKFSMNMNYTYLNVMYERIIVEIYVFLVEKYCLPYLLKKYGRSLLNYQLRET